MYNRASADLAGKPWDPSRAGIRWDAEQKLWVGDVPDYPPDADPKDPKSPLPFIMTGEGTGRLFSNGLVDGPFPEHVERLVKLQPEAFVEIPEELAREKGIETGDMVRVFSKRGKLEVRALVTKRLGALTIDGRKTYQIGIPIHWGYVGIKTGDHWLANALTPFVGDATVRTPEFKAFLVNLEKL